MRDILREALSLPPSGLAVGDFGWGALRSADVSFGMAAWGPLRILSSPHTFAFRHPFARASSSVQNQASPFSGTMIVSSYHLWPGRW